MNDEHDLILEGWRVWRVQIYKKKEPVWRDGGGGLLNFRVHENYEDMRTTRVEFDEKIDRVTIEKDDGGTFVYFDTVPGVFYMTFEYGATLESISEDRLSFVSRHLCH